MRQTRMAFRPLVAVAAALAAAAASCEGDACGDAGGAWMSLLQTARLQGLRTSTGDELPPTEHYWPRRGGDARMSSSTPFQAPSNFSAGPSWVWKNELDEEVRHSPLIDRDMNVYVMTTTRVRKFSRTGDLLWTWQADPSHGKMSMSPALYNSTIFAVVGSGSGQSHLYSIGTTDAKVNWVKSYDQSHGQDSASLFAYNDTLIFPAQTDLLRTLSSGGTNKFVAMSAFDGSRLWEYDLDGIVWNAAVATPGDGSLLVATSCGGVVKLSWDGKLIWKSGTTSISPLCGTGGGALGENGVYYTEYNELDIPGLSFRHTS
jgi:hypothetical protein